MEDDEYLCPLTVHVCPCIVVIRFVDSVWWHWLSFHNMYLPCLLCNTITAKVTH